MVLRGSVFQNRSSRRQEALIFRVLEPHDLGCYECGRPAIPRESSIQSMMPALPVCRPFPDSLDSFPLASLAKICLRIFRRLVQDNDAWSLLSFSGLGLRRAAATRQTRPPPSIMAMLPPSGTDEAEAAAMVNTSMRPY